MVDRPVVDSSRLVSVLSLVAIALFLLAVSSLGSMYALFSAATLVGAAAGLVVFGLRSGRGLGESPAAERKPSRLFGIDIARIPVTGIGGLGLVAIASIIALDLPSGRQLMTWSVTGAVAGAATVIVWRHYRGASPFAETPRETLHLR